MHTIWHCALPMRWQTVKATAGGLPTCRPTAIRGRWLYASWKPKALLSAIVEQRAAPERCNGLDAQQWARWFEDARALFARTWMSLPSTWATIGYDGFAVGGHGAHSPGYQHTEAGSVDAWQLPC